MIVKVQLPLALTGTGLDALIYPKGGQPTTTQNIDTVVMRALAGDAKGYFEAEWSGGLLAWSIGKRVEAQPW